MLFKQSSSSWWICLLLVLSITYQQGVLNNCGGQSSSQSLSNLFQSGSNLLTNTRVQSQRTQTFQVNVNYNIPVQGLNIAISTGLINSYNSNFGTDYSIRAVRVGQSNAVKVILYINSDQSWNIIKASYLIASRPDMFLGSFVTQSFDLLRPNADSYLVENTLPNWTFSSKTFRSVYFVSGLKTSDNSFTLNLREGSFNALTGKMTVRVTSNADPNIELLYLTYVIFQQQTPFSFQTYNPLLTAPRAQFFFEGLKSFNGNSLTYEGYAITPTQNNQNNNQFGSNLNCFGSACPNRCISANDCTFNRGNIFGTNCYICGLRQVYSNGQCVQNCGVNRVRINGGPCTCIAGHIEVGEVCYFQCTQNGFQISTGQCRCLPGFSSSSFGTCTRTSTATCRANEFSLNGQCECNAGLARNNFGLCVVCSVDEIIINKICQCKQGFSRRFGGVCVFIGNSNSQCNRINERLDPALRTCVCRQGFGISSFTNLCQICPPNSRSSGQLSGCICNPGFSLVAATQRCVNVVCQANFIPNANGGCTCSNGFFQQNGQCRPVPTCPARSTWNQPTLLCKCDLANQNLINGICQRCQVNSVWNEFQCVCRSQFFPINGVCTECSTNSEFLRGTCVCKFGYFGNGITCTACDSTCGTCSNQSNTGCLTCASISFTLRNGICTRNVCDKGFFLNPSTTRCDSCPQYCETCTSKLTCTTCIVGFNKDSTSIGGFQTDTCVEICGDGRRFYFPCDDGNLLNGDGCNNLCSVEPGFTCVGGSATSRSTCVNGTPTASIINTGGYVLLNGQILQGVSLSYIPPSLLNNGCPLCDSIFIVQAVNSPITPQITITFIQATLYRFALRFGFGGKIANFVFSFSVRINPALKQFFTIKDMEQVKLVRIDTAVLSRNQRVDELSLSNINLVQTNNQPNTFTTEKIQIEGVPSNAIKILFPQ